MYDAKYANILPKNNKFTELVFKHYQEITSDKLLRSVSFAIVVKEVYPSILHLLICHCTGSVTSLHLHTAQLIMQVHCTSIIFMVNDERLNAGLFYLHVLPLDVYTQIQFLIVPRYHACVRVLKGFFAARGVPTLIISDNGSQIISNETQSFVKNRGNKWQFNLRSAPWWGGMIEWMI